MLKFLLLYLFSQIILAKPSLVIELLTPGLTYPEYNLTYDS